MFNIDLDVRTLHEPSFDLRPRLCIGFSRSVSDCLLELLVLPLLSVPQNPHFSIRRRDLNRSIDGLGLRSAWADDVEADGGVGRRCSDKEVRVTEREDVFLLF